MDAIYSGLILNNEVRISIIDTSETLKHLCGIHKFSSIATQAMGRALTIGSYISYNLKGEDSRFTVIINGQGFLGKIFVSGFTEGRIRGYLENPNLLPKDKTATLREGVGNRGLFTVIKDFSLKVPSVGCSEIINGNLSDDYAYYLFISEGVKNAVGLNVLEFDGGIHSVGMICEALPNASEDTLFILEDIFSYFDNISISIIKQGLTKTLDYYFGHLSCKLLGRSDIVFFCQCSQRFEEVIRGMGVEKINELFGEENSIEMICDYCLKRSSYDRTQIEKIFSRGEK